MIGLKVTELKSKRQARGEQNDSDIAPEIFTALELGTGGFCSNI